MPKPKASYADMIDLPDDPGEDRTTIQSDSRTTVQANDPQGSKAQPDENDGRVQRSLYAKPETFKRLKRYAFENDRPAQELYREALFMLLKKLRLDEGITSPRDV